MDLTKAVQVSMQLLLEEYRGKFIITAERSKTWRQMLRGIDPTVITAAVYHLISSRDSEWPPTVGMVRQVALQFANGELHTPTGYDAWANIQKKFQYEDFPLTDLELAALKQIGTIYDLKRSTNPATDRAHFIKAFNELVNRQQLERVTLPEVKALVEHNVPFLPKPQEKAPERLPAPFEPNQNPEEDPGPERISPEDIREFSKGLAKKIDERESEEALERR